MKSVRCNAYLEECVGKDVNNLLVLDFIHDTVETLDQGEPLILLAREQCLNGV